jgi:uncharacterized protein YbcC (UPF0753/DUF2309 family)
MNKPTNSKSVQKRIEAQTGLKIPTNIEKLALESVLSTEELAKHHLPDYPHTLKEMKRGIAEAQALATAKAVEEATLKRVEDLGTIPSPYRSDDQDEAFINGQIALKKLIRLSFKQGKLE